MRRDASIRRVLKTRTNKRLERIAEIASYLHDDRRVRELILSRSHLYRNVNAYWHAIQRYSFPKSNLRVDVLRTGRVRPSNSASTLGWEIVCGEKVKLHWLPGNHFSIFTSEHIDTLAGSIKECLSTD